MHRPLSAELTPRWLTMPPSVSRGNCRILQQGSAVIVYKMDRMLQLSICSLGYFTFNALENKIRTGVKRTIYFFPRSEEKGNLPISFWQPPPSSWQSGESSPEVCLCDLHDMPLCFVWSHAYIKVEHHSSEHHYILFEVSWNTCIWNRLHNETSRGKSAVGCIL